MNLRDYLHQIAHSPTIEELWDAHTRQMADYGFDRLIYGFTRYRTPTSLGDPADFVILSNQSPEYLNGYLHSGLYFNAPMLRWALNNEGACSWGALPEITHGDDLSESEKREVDFNARLEVTAGYTISFRSISARSKGAIALTARRGLTQDEVDAIWDEHGADIQLMNEIAHLKILSLPYSSPNRSLTRRQLEGLQWVGDGKTTQDIALLMGLTAPTVEKHLRLAREALSVETTAQAVLKAAFANQMFVMDP